MSLLLANRGLIKSASVDTSFKFSIDTSLGTGTTFALPLPSGYTYNFTVDYGDGSGLKTVTAYNDSDAIHNYGVAFSGQITITGVCEAFSFNNGGDKLKITSVDNWGSIELRYMTNGFNGCANLTTTSSAGKLNGTVLLTSLLGLFANCTSLTTIDSDFLLNCQNNCDIGAMFNNCTSLLQLPNISVLTNITDVDFFANNCISIVTIPNNYFVNNTLITSYINTFAGCRNISLPTTLFNLGSLSIVTSFNGFMNSSSGTYSHTGTIQDVWNYATSATSVNTFLNQTSLSNYASIPNGWKGL